MVIINRVTGHEDADRCRATPMPSRPPVPIDHSARGSFRHRALSELDVLALPTG